MMGVREKENGAVYEASLGDLLKEAGVLILAGAVMALLGRNAPMMRTLVTVVLAARFAMLYRRGDVFVFLTGALLGGGNDLLMVCWNVCHYNAPTVLPVPFPDWMILVWGEVFLFFRRLMRFRPFLGPADGALPGTDWALLLDLAILIPLKIVLFRYSATPWIVGTVLGSTLLVRYLVIAPPLHERRLLLAILVLGPAYEFALVASGLYVYGHAAVFGMPVWLPAYWIYVFRVLKTLDDRLELRLAG
jgi:hypothetical protein